MKKKEFVFPPIGGGNATGKIGPYSNTLPASPEANRAGWTSIEEQMPEAGVNVLVYGRETFSETGVGMAVANWDLLGKKPYWNPMLVSGYEWDFDLEVTHWQPLPAPPQ